jgi:hypothetical protein
VGKEALAMLASKQSSSGNYSIKLAAETQRITSDANATAEDRRWAACYSDMRDVGTVNTGARVITLD